MMMATNGDIETTDNDHRDLEQGMQDGDHAERLLEGIQERLDQRMDESDWDEVIRDVIGAAGNDDNSDYYGHDMSKRTAETGLRISCENIDSKGPTRYGKVSVFEGILQDMVNRNIDVKVIQDPGVITIKENYRG